MTYVDRGSIAELYRTPRPSAEELDPELIEEGTKEYGTKRGPSGMLHSAWYFAELALSSFAMERKVRIERFYVVQYLTPMIVDHPSSSQDEKLHALTLATYLPVFIKRSDGEMLTSDDCSDVYRSLGYAMRYLRPLEINEPPQWRMVETAMLALSARTRQPHLLMYPTSPREEMSDIHELNHDSYYFESGKKLPIQQKIEPTDDAYDEWVQLLTIQPLLDKALKDAGLATSLPLSEKVNYLLSLIVTETTGLGMTRQERQFINELTESIASHYYVAKQSQQVPRAA